MKFCVKCGKDIQGGIFCSSCQPIEKELKPLELERCHCGHVRVGKSWTADVENVILEHVKMHGSVEIFEPGAGQKDSLAVIKEPAGNKTISNSREHHVKIRFNEKECPHCHKENISYYEGILQIRTKRESVLSKAYSFLDKKLAKSEKVFISKIEDQNDGVDLYFSDKRHMRSIAQKLKMGLGGKMSLNAQLFSHNRQTSRDIFRLNIILRLPDVDVGDIVATDGMPVVISWFSPLKGKSLLNGKSVKVYGCSILDLHKTTISCLSPLEAIHPNTFQSDTIQNPRSRFKLGEKVTVVIFKNGLFLV